MGLALRLVLGSLILLVITVEPSRAADHQFSCKGDVVQGETNPLERCQSLFQLRGTEVMDLFWGVLSPRGPQPRQITSFCFS